MDVRIGVIYSAREIEVDLGDEADHDSVQKEVEHALTKGSNVLWLTDRRGRKVAVPSEKIAFVEIGSGNAERRMGFVS